MSNAGNDGFEVARAVQEKNLRPGVMLTMHNSESLLTRKLDAGAKGFLLKDGALPEIIDCIKPSPPVTTIQPPLSTYLFDA